MDFVFPRFLRAMRGTKKAASKGGLDLRFR
jgi:hypothetical protein